MNKNDRLKALKYTSYIALGFACLMIAVYCVDNMSQCLRGREPQTPTEFITNASSFAQMKPTGDEKRKQSKPAHRIVKHPVYNDPTSKSEQERMGTVASYINQNRQHGIKRATYNPKTNRIAVQYDHKKPSQSQKRYTGFLLKSLNAD